MPNQKTGPVMAPENKMHGKIDDNAKKELLAKSEISLILDTYDDIFSDFDPRPYPQRGLSEDFLREAKKSVSVAEKGNLHLGFIMPAAQRNTGHEALIKKRLREYFKKQTEILESAKKKIIRDSWIMTALGFAVLMLAAYVVSLGKTEFIYSMLLVILEPAGWFLAWSGLDNIYLRAGEKNPEIEFYRRMGKTEIEFTEY